MSRKKKSTNSETEQKVEEIKEVKEVLITFDAWFASQVSTYKNFPHHKAPMRQFAKAKGLETGTKEQFDKVFKGY